jgi:mannose-6-phosphate isomerase
VNGPLRFEPYCRPTVWGGRRLADLLHKPLSAGLHGETWEISDHLQHQSRVATGPLGGLTLRELMQSHAADLFGRSLPPAVFPWLIKHLDARDWLSVQVHPDDEKAKRLAPGERGKTEAWLVLAADPTSRIWAGLKPGVDEPTLRAALAAGTVAECLDSFTPRPGDCLYLPAGTVHAVGGGVLLVEIQQTSDATFRLFDWNRTDAQGRRRALHVEEALACVDWNAGPVEPLHIPGYPDANDPLRQRLVECPYFRLDYRREREPFALGEGVLQVAVVLHGSGKLSGPEQSRLAPGDVLLLPATMPALEVRPDETLGLLLTTLPSERAGEFTSPVSSLLPDRRPAR